MRRLSCLLLLAAAGHACSADRPRPAGFVEADQTFQQALWTGEMATAVALVDPQATWTDAGGRTLDGAVLSRSLPTPSIRNESRAEIRHTEYGAVAVARVDEERLHILRVWVRRADGWRLLAYQEVESLARPPSAAPPPGTEAECINPCRTIPYEPKTDNERGVVEAYLALETAAHAADADQWPRHVADEFVLVSSNSNRVVDKPTRLEGLRRSAYGGVAPSELVSAEMFDFGDAVVMRARHQPPRGNPLFINRVWVNRGGTWMSVLSYQTAIRR